MSDSKPYRLKRLPSSRLRARTSKIYIPINHERGYFERRIRFRKASLVANRAGTQYAAYGKLSPDAVLEMTHILFAARQRPKVRQIVDYLLFVRSQKIENGAITADDQSIDGADINRYLNEYLVAIKCTCWPVK